MISCHDPLGRQVAVTVYKDQKVLPGSFRNLAKIKQRELRYLAKTRIKTTFSIQYLSLQRREVHTAAGVNPCKQVLEE